MRTQTSGRNGIGPGRPDGTELEAGRQASRRRGDRVRQGRGEEEGPASVGIRGRDRGGDRIRIQSGPVPSLGLRAQSSVVGYARTSTDGWDDPSPKLAALQLLALDWMLETCFGACHVGLDAFYHRPQFNFAKCTYVPLVHYSMWKKPSFHRKLTATTNQPCLTRVKLLVRPSDIL